MIRVIGFVRRKDSLTHEEFRDRYEEHVSTVEKLPHLRRYTQLVPSDPEACPYDGIGELYFDTVEDCREAFDSPAGDAQFEDAKRFAKLPDTDDPQETARSNNLSMMFEIQVDTDYNGS